MCKIIIVWVSLIALAFAFPGGLGGCGNCFGQPQGPPPPPFLQNVSLYARHNFFKIFNDRKLTKGEIMNKVAEWAKKYSISEKVTEFEKEMENENKERRQEIMDTVGQLADAITTLNAIEDDKSITPFETMKKITETIDGFSPELRDLVLATGHPRHPFQIGGHGLMGGFGGFGEGGAQNGFQGFGNFVPIGLH